VKTQQRSLEPDTPLPKWTSFVVGVLIVLVGVATFYATLRFYGDGTDRAQAGRDAMRTAGTLVVGAGGLFALVLTVPRQR